MKILAFDTSSSRLSIALSTETGAKHLFEPGIDLKHSVNLAPSIKKLIDEAGWQFGELDIIAAGCGPGSFTGIRIGVASLKALYAATGAKVVGLSSFTGALHGLPEDAPLVAPLLDARKGKVYTRFYLQKSAGVFIPVSGHILSRWEDLARGLKEEVYFFGDGVASYKSSISEHPAARIDPRTEYRVRADIIAKAAHDEDDDVCMGPESIKPIYLFPDDCTIKK